MSQGCSPEMASLRRHFGRVAAESTSPRLPEALSAVHEFLRFQISDQDGVAMPTVNGNWRSSRQITFPKESLTPIVELLKCKQSKNSSVQRSLTPIGLKKGLSRKSSGQLSHWVSIPACRPGYRIRLGHLGLLLGSRPMNLSMPMLV